jgi:hypothetical protein
MISSISTSDINNIKTTYGKKICGAIGEATIRNLTQVNGYGLRMNFVSERIIDFPEEWLNFSIFEQHSAVRGITKDSQPFIAVKLDVITEKRIHQGLIERSIQTVLEVVHKYYGIDGDGGENGFYPDNYIVSTPRGNFSFISNHANMLDHQMALLGSILKSEKVQSKVYAIENPSLKLAPVEPQPEEIWIV